MIHRSTRRHFLKTSGSLLALTMTGKLFDLKKDNLLLSFSTLGCPDWSFQKIVTFASENDYRGIEIRGIQRQMDLTQCKEFNSGQNIATAVSLMKDRKLNFVDLGSSAEMHHSNEADRQKNLDEAKRFLDLAGELNCPFIRVFPNSLSKENRNASIDLIVKGLTEAGDYARGSKVMVLMETHGDVVESTVIKQIMDAVNHPNVGLVWDISNMWTVTKEPPAQAYQSLKKYIHHTHIKDAKIVGGEPQYKLMGRGEVPIFEAIDVLHKDGYKGYYSFEWEKLWHPDIEGPEIALTDYPKVMKQHFKES